MLTEEIVTKIVVRLLTCEGESEGLVDLAGRGQHVVRPQGDSAIPGFAGEIEALRDQAAADTETTSFGSHQQDAQLGNAGFGRGDAQDASCALAVHLGDPSSFASGVMIDGIFSDDLGD